MYYSPNIFSGDQIKKNEMGGACNTFGGAERCIQGFLGGEVRERDHLEDLDIDRRIIIIFLPHKQHPV